MVRILKVVDGKYINLFKLKKGDYERILESVDVPDINAWNKYDSLQAKKNALILAKEFKKIWFKVAILPHWSYGNKAPYRYEIVSWGGVKK